MVNRYGTWIIGRLRVSPQSGTSDNTLDDGLNTAEQSKVELGQCSCNWNIMRDLGHVVSIGSVTVGDNKPSGQDCVEPSMNNIHPGIEEDFNTTCDYYMNNFHLSGRCSEWSDWIEIEKQEAGLRVAVREFTNSTPVTFNVYWECVKGCCVCVHSRGS